MGHDLVSSSGLIGICITAIATVVVAVIANWRGKAAARSDSVPRGHDSAGQHAHTRDLVRSLRTEMHLRFDAIQDALGMGRQSEQVRRSKRRLKLPGWDEEGE